MSDDPPPPDHTRTADIPLGGFSADADRPPEILSSETTADPSTLFSEAKPLGLSRPRTHGGPAPQPNILEGAERPFGDRLMPLETIGRVRALMATGRDHAEPIYRRQGALAVAGLCLLAAVVAFSFPRTRAATLGSDVQADGQAPDPAAPNGSAAASNADDSIDAVGSDGLFTGSKAERALADEAGRPTPVGSTSTSTETTVGETEQLPTFAELIDTSVVVGPEDPACPDPAATPPDCNPPATTEPPTTETTIVDSSTTETTEPATSIETTTTSESTTTTESPTSTTTTIRTTTTERQTTTTQRTTTTRRTTTTEATTTTTRPTTSNPTTTEPTTTEPTTTSTSTTTSTETTTTEPTTTSTTTSTETTGPTESTGPTPTAVVCDPDGNDPGPTLPPSSGPCPD